MAGLDPAPKTLEPPSFEPWLGRVRMARSFCAAAGFVLVGALSWSRGVPVDDALLRSIVVAIACYFVAWGGALWLCSELYFAQIARIRQSIVDRERRRGEQLEDLYRQRMSSSESSGGGSGVSTTPLDAGAMGQRPAA